MDRVLKATAVAVALALAAACSSGTSGGSKTAACGTGGASSLTGAGATFPAPLYQRWGVQYEQLCGVQINYQAIGSGGGIQQITSKTVDFGASDAPMKPEERAAAPGVIHIPTVFGAVVVTYNVPGVSGLKLTGSVIADIFRRTVTRWNDPTIAALNAGASLPSTSIFPVHRSDGSGTTSIFTSYLDTVSPAWHAAIGKGKEVKWPAGELGGKGNDGVAAAVKQNQGAIGYVELAYATQSGLPVASIKNAAGEFVEPTLASIRAAAAGATVGEDLTFSLVDQPGAGVYPIAGATWLLVYKTQTDRAKGTALVRFLWWALHDGRAAAEPLLYATLPPALLTKAEGAIRSITFDGEPLYKG